MKEENKKNIMQIIEKVERNYNLNKNNFKINHFYLLSMFSNIIKNKIFASLTNMSFLKKENNVIVDPFSCLLKLSLLSFYPEGTKISIDNNEIFINAPTLLQGALRYYYGYGREDLHNLLVPIQKAIVWFFNKDDTYILFLFNLSIQGLQNLKKSYPTTSTIHHTLDYYITLLTSKTRSIPSVDADEMSSSTESNGEEKETNVHEFLKKLWSKREIHVVILLLQEIVEKNYEENSVEQIEYLISCIQTICKEKEERLNKYIETYSSSL